jgi:hypothetical protein
MYRKNQTLVAIGVCMTFLLLGCGQVTLVPTLTSVDEKPSLTLTPTPDSEEPSIALTPTSTLTPTVPLNPPDPGEPPDHGEIELFQRNFLEPGSEEECISRFPFVVIQETEPATIKGEGVIDCHFQATYCGEACVTMHMIQQYDVTVAGEIVPDAGSGGTASLHVVLTLDGGVKEYFSDYPPEAIMIFTEDHPFVIEGTGPLPLEFDYVDGATDTITRENPKPEGEAPSEPVEWVFTLHLGG